MVRRGGGGERCRDKGGGAGGEGGGKGGSGVGGRSEVGI